MGIAVGLLEISARDALAHVGADSYRAKWPDHRFPAERHEGLIEVLCSPTFEIRRDDRIFTIGSCFARNIEQRLREIGLDTVLYDQETVQGLEAVGEALPFTNKYNVAAIRTELGWACGGARPPEEFILLPLADGKALDGLLNPRRKTGADLQDARRRRAFVEAKYHRIAECRVVVMTLGLVEVWRDKASGLHLNVAPLGPIEAEPDRFVLDVMSYDEILGELEAIHAILKAACPEDMRILITVSPVPLQATFRDEDVMVANSYSKAVQRAAVEAFVLKHDNVDYFPSYETVTLTDRRLAFDKDNRHVQTGVVARIVDRFVAAYIPELAFQPTRTALEESVIEVETARDLLSAAKLHGHRELHAEAAEYYRRLIAQYGDCLDLIPASDLHLRFSAALLKSGQITEGLREVELAALARDALPALMLKCVDRLLAHKDPAGAARILEAVGHALDPTDVAERRRRIGAAAPTA